MKFSMQDFLVDFRDEINEIFEDIETIENEPVNRDRIISVVSEVLAEEKVDDTDEFEVLGLIERVASNRYEVDYGVKVLQKSILKDNLRMHVESSRY